jgi:hypothetical protein
MANPTTPTTAPRGERYPGIHDAQGALDHLADSISEFARCSDETRRKFLSLFDKFMGQAAPLLEQAKAENAADHDGPAQSDQKAQNTVESKNRQKRIVKISPRVDPSKSPQVVLSQAGDLDEGDLLASFFEPRSRPAGIPQPSRLKRSVVGSH